MNTVDVTRVGASQAVGKRAARLDPLHVCFGAFELDEPNALLLRNGTPVTLPPRPFALLCSLARRPGSLLTKTTLLDDVWGHQYLSDSVLRTAITELRTVLGDDPRKPRFIETVSRRGYRFIVSTTPIGAAADERTTLTYGPAGLPDFHAAARNVALCGTPRAACEAASIDTSRCCDEHGWPKSTYATNEEVRCAQRLWMRLRARLLRDVAPEASSCMGAV